MTLQTPVIASSAAAKQSACLWLLHFALVALQDVVEVRGDREGLAFNREVLGCDVDKELAPARLVELRPDCGRVDARVPVEALDDAVGLNLGAGRQRDEVLGKLGVCRLGR